MNRSMAGGLLTALALAGTAVVAAPSFAGDGETGTFQGEATQVPVDASPGEQVRVFDESCWEGTASIWWALRPEDGSEVLASGHEPLFGDGSWEVTLTAPDGPGWYLFTGLCLPPGVDVPDTALIDEIRDVDGAPPELFEAWGVDSMLYYAQIVNVVAPGTSTTTPTPTTVPADPTTTVPAETPPAAPPAQPVPATPTFAG